MYVPETLIKAWRWARHDIPDVDPDTLETRHLVKLLREQEVMAEDSLRTDRDYLENLMVYRESRESNDRGNPHG